MLPKYMKPQVTKKTAMMVAILSLWKGDEKRQLFQHYGCRLKENEFIATHLFTQIEASMRKRFE